MTEEQRNEYMKRLTQEYERFKQKMYTSHPSEVFAEAQHIVSMQYAYDYLRSADISADELEYVMQAQEPIKEVACTREAMDEVSYFDNPMKFTVQDIHDKDLFNDPEVNKYTDRIPIRFHRKVCSIEEIEEFSRMGEDDKFQIEKIILMPTSEFEMFSHSLLDDHPIIMENQNHMWMDEDAWHCLLVKDAGSERGLLCESEGFDYSRYTAYVQDTRELDFQNIPSEEYARPKGRRRKVAKQPER